MNFTFLRQKVIASIKRQIEAWFDLERGGWAVPILLFLFVAVWTAFHAISHASVDLHPDQLEIYAWSRHPSTGYYKHPPLGALIATAWFSVFPAADWSFRLLETVNAAIALLAIAGIARLYLPGDKRLLVLLLLLLTPFYQFRAQPFGSNQVLLSTWPIATYCFLRAFKTRGLAWSAAAGIAAGLALLGKYTSAYLVAAFIVAALAHPARWTYLFSPSPWISVGAGLLVIAPHLYWLTTGGAGPLDYLYVAHGGSLLAVRIAYAATYLLGAIAYVTLLVAAYAMVVRPDLPTLMRTIWPPEPDHRMLVILLVVVLVLPALSAPFLGVELTSLWTMQSWFLLPIVLLAPQAAVVPRSRAVGVAAGVCVIAGCALIAAPLLAWNRHVGGTKHKEAYYRLASNEITQEWRRRTGRPLTIVMGDYSEAVTFYAPDHPDSVPHFNASLAPWIGPARIEREGYAVLCEERLCISIAENLAAANPRAVRRDIELARSYLGRRGPSVRFVIFVVPPRAATGPETRHNE
jgi:4-amino-4-deoxy-L-arabinose transferase-like glycosyltransferase